MRDMRESGVEWLDEIPATWDLVQLGSLFSEHKHKNTGMQSENLLSLSYGNIIRKDINTSDGLLPESFEGYNVIDDGDIVLRLTDLQNDQRSLRVGLSHERGIVTSAYVTLRKRNPAINSKFYYYLIHSYDIRKGFYGMGAGVRQGLNYAGVKKIMLTLPPVGEQESIVALLGERTAKVDALIANVQAQIEKLKAYKQSMITEVVTKGLDPSVPMKDSGVEWVGKIPEHWGLMRVSDIGDFKKGPFGSAVKKEMFVEKGPNTYKVYEQKNAIYKDASLGYYYLPQEDYNRLISFAVQPGDMIVSCAGTIGESFIMPENCEEGIINQALMRVRLNGKVNHAFFVYVFSCIMDLETPKYSNGSAMKNIPPFNYLLKFLLPCPPVSEQDAIVTELASRCEMVDQLIAIKQKKIDKLNEYKKSLIYEYVTGKREVS